MFFEKAAALPLVMLTFIFCDAFSASGPKACAQEDFANSVKRTSVETRIRTDLAGDRNLLAGAPANSNTKSRLNQQIKQQIQERRAQKLQTIQEPVQKLKLSSSDTESDSLIQPAQPIQTLQSNTPDDSQLWQPESNSNFPNGQLENTIEAFETLAIQNHPTLNAAVARILTARHEALQAGLAPNPRLALFMDEVGNENDPGLWGAYLQRNIVRGNKRALSRRIKNREASVLEMDFETQVLRIKTDVRSAFYKLLIMQQKYELASRLYEAQQSGIAKSTQLYEAGETPKTDLLQTELQAQKTLILLSQAEVAQQNAWRQLATVIGQPQLPQQTVSGSLDPIAEPISFDECLAEILANSPELLSANAEVDRVLATIDREIAGTIPDYQTQVTLGRDSTSNHFFTGVQLQVPLQICDRNQGNIAAAKSRLVVAQNNVDKIKLDLSRRLTSEFQRYQSALVKSEMFSERLLPKSQQTLDLLVSGYPEEVSFLQLLTAQQTVIDITMEYLDSINQLWNSRVKIEGLLLDDSLGQ